MAAQHAATRARTPVATTAPRCPPYQGSKTGRCDVATVSPISGLENRSLRRRIGVPHIRARKPVATTSTRRPPYPGSKVGRESEDRPLASIGLEKKRTDRRRVEH